MDFSSLVKISLLGRIAGALKVEIAVVIQHQVGLFRRYFPWIFWIEG
jgi:hypothetical protein